MAGSPTGGVKRWPVEPVDDEMTGSFKDVNQRILGSLTLRLFLPAEKRNKQNRFFVCLRCFLLTRSCVYVTHTQLSYIEAMQDGNRSVVVNFIYFCR